MITNGGPHGRPSDNPTVASAPADRRDSGITQSVHLARDDARQANIRDNPGSIDMSTHYEAPAPPRESVTSSLPASPRAFVGRDRELRKILDAAGHDRVVAIHAIDGMAGIGKTALAIRAAHQLASHYPDGQFFIELHAHTPGQHAADPSEVLAGLLIELGLDPRSIPDTLTGRRDLWRSRTLDRRVLVVLDDAADRRQIEPLLPSGADCLTLVTSRHRLLLLADMQPLPLTVLDGEAATEMFLTVAHRNGRLACERRIALRVSELCGFLPLAIGLVAGRVAHHPGWTTDDISDLADEFADATDRLDAVDSHDPVVRAAFDLSYRELPAPRQLLFAQLGLHPGPDLDAHAVAALAGKDHTTTKHELHALYNDHLLEEPTRGRYRLHDLLRAYARTLCDDDTRALDRLLDYYQHAAARADRKLTLRTRPTPTCAADRESHADSTIHVPEFGDHMQALAWMRIERANLMACLEHIVDREPCRLIALTAAMAGLLDNDGPWPQAMRLHRRAADTAHNLDDRLQEANALTELAYLSWLANDNTRTADLNNQALKLYRDLENRLGQAHALNGIGYVRRSAGYNDQAAELYRQALELYVELADRLGEAMAMNNLGLVCQDTGDYGRAAELHQRALTHYIDLGNRHGQAHALNNLGLVHRHTRDYERAAELHHRALALYTEIGDRQGQAYALNTLGLVHQDTRDYERAAALHSRALELYIDIGIRPTEAHALNNLALVYGHTGDYDRAVELHRRALTIYREIGSPVGQARQLNNIGRALLSTLPAEALNAFTDALELACEVDHHLEQAHALEGCARSRNVMGDCTTAAIELSRALTIYRRLGSPEIVGAEALLDELTSAQD